MGAVTNLVPQKHPSLTILLFLMTMVIIGAVVADAGEATSWIEGDDVNGSSSGAIPCRSSSGDGCLVADDGLEFLPMDLGTSRMLAAVNGGRPVTRRTKTPSRPSVACGRRTPYKKCLPDRNGNRPPCPPSPYRRAC